MILAQECDKRSVRDRPASARNRHHPNEGERAFGRKTAGCRPADALNRGAGGGQLGVEHGGGQLELRHVGAVQRVQAVVAQHALLPTAAFVAAQLQIADARHVGLEYELAWAPHPALRLAYIGAYVANQPLLRSLCWVGALLCTALLYTEGLKALLRA